MASWPKSNQLMTYETKCVAKPVKSFLRPSHTPRHVGPMRALSSQNDFVIQSLTREMYVHNNCQLRCEISARVISRAAPIKANCGALSPACAANSQPPRRLYLRNARHRHTSGRVMHCVCVCARFVIAACRDAPNK
jgi:hypothetical protein